MRRLLATTAVLLLPATAAVAAEPGSGEVSKASPRVIWTGSTTNSWFNYTLINADNSADCTAPLCDRFTLKVVDGGFDMVVKVRADSQTTDGANVTGGVRITAPDGSGSWTTGETGPDKDLKVTVKKAVAGEWLIDYTNTFVGGAQTYAASAELLVPPPAVAPAAPMPAAPPAAAPAAVTLSAKPFAAKAGRKLVARLRSSGSLTGLTAVLAKGGKKLATGKLAALNGNGKLTIRPKRRLKPGRYLLTVTGKDAAGRVVTAQAAVTIRR